MGFVSGAKGTPRRSDRRGGGAARWVRQGGSGRQRINFSRGARRREPRVAAGDRIAGLETREGLFGKCAHLRRGRPRRSCRTTPRLRLRGLGDGSVGGECRAVEDRRDHTHVSEQRLKLKVCWEGSGAHLLRQSANGSANATGYPVRRPARRHGRCLRSVVWPPVAGFLKASKPRDTLHGVRSDAGGKVKVKLPLHGVRPRSGRIQTCESQRDLPRKKISVLVLNFGEKADDKTATQNPNEGICHDMSTGSIGISAT